MVNNVAGIDGHPNGTLVICPSGTATAGGTPLAMPPGTNINNKTPDSPGFGNTSFPTSAGFFSFVETIVLVAAGAGGGAGPGDNEAIVNAAVNSVYNGYLENAGVNFPVKSPGQLLQLSKLDSLYLQLLIKTRVLNEQKNLLDEMENDASLDPNPFPTVARAVVPVLFLEPGPKIIDVKSYVQLLENDVRKLKGKITELGGDPENNPLQAPDQNGSNAPGELAPYIDNTDMILARNEGVQAINEGFSQDFTLAPGGFENAHVTRGETFDIWTRLKFSLIDGAAGFDGQTFHGQLGAVRSVSDTIDLGVFVALFAGDIDSGSLAADMQALGLGAGAYVKARIGERTNASLVFDYERSENDISVAGATGSFNRDRFELNASIDDTIFIGNVRVNRTANISWDRSDREGYTNSAAIFVPGRVDDVVTATGALNFSRTIMSDLPNVLTITPSLGLALNYHIEQVDDITFANGSQLEFSTFTSDVNAGVSLLLVNGGTLSLAGGVAGLGGDVLAYSASARFTVPLP